jgi:hypothetical protein
MSALNFISAFRRISRDEVFIFTPLLVQKSPAAKNETIEELNKNKRRSGDE